MEKTMTVNQTEYTIVKLLGHGKGGYSYLASRDGEHVVLKQIHHEPCAYYTFGNKIEAEQVRAHGLNIDYFPTNFVVQDELVYYVDYECNPYSEEWSFENWGVTCYSKQALSKEEA